jgi:hypothetical protein
VSFRGGNSADSTIGAAIVGGGTGTIHTLAIENATRTGAKYRIAAASNNVLNISSQLRGATSTGSTYWIEGPGIIRLSGTNANPSSAPITVDSGTLELNKTDGVDALSTSVTLRVNAAGTVKWLAGNQIRDDVPLTLAGGTLQVNGCSETASTLQLTAGSTIDFGAGAAALVFANSSALSWGGFALAVQNWTAGSDTLRVGTDSGGLTSSQLSGISFAGYAAGAQIDSQGFVTPIPEPASAALLAGGVAWAWLRRRRAP